MFWRGSRIVVRVYDPERAGGTRQLGTFGSLEEAQAARDRWDRLRRRRERGFREWRVEEFCEVWCVSDYLRPEETTNIHNRQMVKPFARDFGGLLMQEVAEMPDLCRLWAFGGVVRPDLERFAAGWVVDRVGTRAADARDEEGRMVVPAHLRNARVVSTMFADARRSQIVDRNPWGLLRLPGFKGRQDIEPLRPGQVTALIEEAVRQRPDYLDFPALIATAAYTGMRLGELAGLRWEDLDFERYRVTVRRQWRDKDRRERPPKYGSSREILLPPPAVEWLRRLPRHVDGLVFHTVTGRRYSQRIHHMYWNPVRRAVGLPDLAFHELRHFCGSYLADKGASPRDIAHQFGHKDGGLLAARLYCHTYTDRANERLATIFGL